jgi:hypothetical protein
MRPVFLNTIQFIFTRVPQMTLVLCVAETSPFHHRYLCFPGIVFIPNNLMPDEIVQTLLRVCIHSVKNCKFTEDEKGKKSTQKKNKNF